MSSSGCSGDCNSGVIDHSVFHAARRYHQWDGKNTIELMKFVSCITNDQRRSLVRSVIESFQHNIINTDIASQFRTGLIHGDYNDANIILNPKNFHITGIIDFGDSVERYEKL
jgi:Ser/Thr protein kinase RdoA (MazF antagonist)